MTTGNHAVDTASFVDRAIGTDEEPSHDTKLAASALGCSAEELAQVLRMTARQAETNAYQRVLDMIMKEMDNRSNTVSASSLLQKVLSWAQQSLADAQSTNAVYALGALAKLVSKLDPRA